MKRLLIIFLLATGTIAAETLVGLGYTNIWNLSGGMVAWEQAGLQVDR